MQFLKDFGKLIGNALIILIPARPMLLLAGCAEKKKIGIMRPSANRRLHCIPAEAYSDLESGWWETGPATTLI